MKKLCSVLSTVLLACLLALALAVAAPLLLGYQELAVLSGSMEPGIPVGSVVYVDDDIQPSELKTGDVVTYALESDVYVTHRVVSIDPDKQVLVTKGDANEVEDGEIKFDQIVGKVTFHLPYLGILTSNVRTSKGIMTITIAIVVILALNFLPAVLTSDKKEKTGKVKKNKRSKK